jgi:parvulin-like peptidyl-prolyl isomerase
MANKFFKNLIFCTIVLFTFQFCKKPEPQQVIATFQNGTIQVVELQNALQREKENFDPKGKNWNRIKAETLQELIDRKLLLQEAALRKITVSKEEYQKEVRKFKTNYTEAGFKKMLEERGIQEKDWMRLRWEDLNIFKLIKSLYPANSPVEESFLKKYYEEHLEQFMVAESVHVRQIVTDSKEKADFILQRLQKGENFAKLARELSLSPDRWNGGDIGLVFKGVFPREFEICFSMRPGEISPIIPSRYGFHLFKVLDKNPAQTYSFEEVRDKIIMQLQADQYDKYVKAYIKDLRAQANLTVYQPILERIEL